MARHSSGVKTAAGSTTLPIISLYSTASVAGTIREIGLFNTTTSGIELKVQRLTTTGTQGTGLTEAAHDPNQIPRCSGFTTHTGAPTLGDDLGYRAVLGAAIGSGVIFTFGGDGIEMPLGASNGIGVLVESGTGATCQAYIVWDE